MTRKNIQKMTSKPQNKPQESAGISGLVALLHELIHIIIEAMNTILQLKNQKPSKMGKLCPAESHLIRSEKETRWNYHAIYVYFFVYIFIKLCNMKNIMHNIHKVKKKGGKPMTEQLTEQGLEARNKYSREYLRKWRASNPDKVKATQIRYWNRRAEKAKMGAVSNGNLEKSQ